MKKIFIADPALKDYRGHHFGLTETISMAFLQEGYEVIWLANKEFNADLYEGDCLINPAFSQGTYDGYKRRQDSNAAANQDNSNNNVTEEGDVDQTQQMPFLKRLYKRLPESWRRFLSPRLRKIVDNFRNSAAADYSDDELAEVSGEGVPEEIPLRPEQELYRALKKYECTEDDVVLFHTCDAHTYGMVLEFFLNNTQVSEWNRFPVFHLSTPYDDDIMPHNRRAGSLAFNHNLRRLASLGLIGKRVFLYAENELLVNHLASICDLEFQALPIPPFSARSPEPKATTDSDDKDISRLNVMYLGAARTEKGFTVLPEVIETVLASDYGKNIDFTIQITPQIMGYTADVEKAVNVLKEIESPQLRLLSQSLSPESYRAMLEAADVMLLCYDDTRYRVRSSGIAIEAIVNNANIVATCETFPHYIAAESGLGAKYSDPDSVCLALEEIAGNLDKYKALARDRKANYLQSSSGGKFVEKVVNRGSLIDVPLRPLSIQNNDTTQWQLLVQ